MSIDVKVYDNGDHTCLVWLPSDGKPIADCRGFTVHKMRNDGKTTTESYLHGFVGFSDDDKLDPAATWKFALQRYMWWDYAVTPGDIVQYSVVPVVGPDKDHLQLLTADASAMTAPMTVTGQATTNVSAYFNRGIVSAQWVSRALDALGKNPKIADLIADTTPPGNTLRNALSGLLRPQLLEMLADVKKNDGQIYAALYELNDPELIAALKALGKNCHLILANGAFNKKNAGDENKAIRAELRSIVDLHDRIVTGNHFAHNKFVVCCDSSGKPQRVLSGSTNWTKTGLCTQANNGIIVNDPDLAADFLDEWNLLKAAGNSYPPGLAKANSSAKSFTVDGGRITQWFAPTSAGQDLDYARTLINGAKQGILFLFFNPGVFVAAGQPEEKWTLLQNILFRHHQGTSNFDGGLYIRGVVNQEIANLTTDGSNGAHGKPTTHAALDPTAGTPVTLFSGGNQPPQHLGYESMVPKNIKEVFHNWATEILGAGVHIHSKVVVIDPFGDHPVVITGSHNLGYKASTANDDNMMIVEGNAPLAAAYAANIIAIYQTYRWNAYVEAHRQDPKVWHGLVDNASWQNDYLTGNDLAEIQFWLGSHQSVAGASATLQPPSAVPAHDPSPTPETPPASTRARSSTAKPARERARGKVAAARKASPAKRKAAKKKAPRKVVKKAAAKKLAVKRKSSTKKKTAKKR